MLNLDLEKAKELVGLAIAERGDDYVYPNPGQCRNVDNISYDVWDDNEEEYVASFDGATPGCLVGHALFLGGIPLSTMGANGVNDEGSDDLLSHLRNLDLITCDSSAMAYLANVQSSQDSLAPWGKAAEAAARGATTYPKRDNLGNKVPGEYEEQAGLRVE